MRFVLFKVVSSFERNSEDLLNFLLSETTDWKGISDSQLMGYLAQLDKYRQSLESELDVLNERIVEADQTASRIDSILANRRVADFDQQRKEQAKALVDKSSCLNERLGVQKRLVRCLDQISCIHRVRVERLEGFLRLSLGGMNQALLFQQEGIRGVRADQQRLFEGVRELCDSLGRDKAALSQAWVSVRSELELIRSELSGRDGEIKALREVLEARETGVSQPQLEGQIAALKVEFLSVLNNRMNVLSQEEKIVEGVLDVVVSETFDELMESDLLLKDEFERLLPEILIDDLVRDFALEGFKANAKCQAFYGGVSEKYGRKGQNLFWRAFRQLDLSLDFSAIKDWFEALSVLQGQADAIDALNLEWQFGFLGCGFDTIMSSARENFESVLGVGWRQVSPILERGFDGFSEEELVACDGMRRLIELYIRHCDGGAQAERWHARMALIWFEAGIRMLDNAHWQALFRSPEGWDVLPFFSFERVSNWVPSDPLDRVLYFRVMGRGGIVLGEELLKEYAKELHSSFLRFFASDDPVWVSLGFELWFWTLLQGDSDFEASLKPLIGTNMDKGIYFEPCVALSQGLTNWGADVSFFRQYHLIASSLAGGGPFPELQLWEFSDLMVVREFEFYPDIDACWKSFWKCFSDSAENFIVSEQQKLVKLMDSYLKAARKIPVKSFWLCAYLDEKLDEAKFEFLCFYARHIVSACEDFKRYRPYIMKIIPWVFKRVGGDRKLFVSVFQTLAPVSWIPEVGDLLKAALEGCEAEKSLLDSLKLMLDRNVGRGAVVSDEVYSELKMIYTPLVGVCGDVMRGHDFVAPDFRRTQSLSEMERLILTLWDTVSSLSTVGMVKILGFLSKGKTELNSLKEDWDWFIGVFENMVRFLKALETYRGNHPESRLVSNEVVQGRIKELIRACYEFVLDLTYGKDFNQIQSWAELKFWMESLLRVTFMFRTHSSLEQDAYMEKTVSIIEAQVNFLFEFSGDRIEDKASFCESFSQFLIEKDDSVSLVIRILSYRFLKRLGMDEEGLASYLQRMKGGAYSREYSQLLELPESFSKFSWLIQAMVVDNPDQFPDLKALFTRDNEGASEN